MEESGSSKKVRKALTNGQNLLLAIKARNYEKNSIGGRNT